MADKEFQDVHAFQVKYNQIVSDKPTHLTRRKLAERANFMLEELREFGQASGLELVLDLETGKIAFAVDEFGSQDLAGQADALVDLVYVAKGTAVMEGLPWEELWDDVQRANMAKVLGITHRGYLMDVKKPEGWVAPHTEAILLEAGYRPEAFTIAVPDLVEDVRIIADDLCRDDACYKPE